MRSSSLLTTALALALTVGCSGGSSAPRAGSQPLPSSGPGPQPAPVSNGPSAPMFAGAARRTPAGAARALSKSPMITEARERRQAAERLISPALLREQRAQIGRELAADMAQAAANADDDDVCVQAWAAQHAMGDELPAARRIRRNDFLDACRNLPEGARRCMSPVYFRANMAECAATQQATYDRMQREGRLDAAGDARGPTIRVDYSGPGAGTVRAGSVEDPGEDAAANAPGPVRLAPRPATPTGAVPPAAPARSAEPTPSSAPARSARGAGAAEPADAPARPMRMPMPQGME